MLFLNPTDFHHEALGEPERLRAVGFSYDNICGL
nr:MAG TPA: hypothetical protein [Caudoviricetes sp.]